MTESQGSSTSASGDKSPLILPPRANLEHLKNQAKRRLDALRRTDPRTKLADAQYAVARDYGFKSWRSLKAHIGAAHKQLAPAMAAAMEATQRGDVNTLLKVLDASPDAIHAIGRQWNHRCCTSQRIRAIWT